MVRNGAICAQGMESLNDLVPQKQAKELNWDHRQELWTHSLLEATMNAERPSRFYHRC